MIFGSQFERRQRRLLPDMQRGDLVRGDTRVGAGSLCGLRADAAQPGCWAERVYGGRISGFMAQARDDIEPAAEWFEWFEDTSELEIRAFFLRSPLIHDRAVRNVNESQAGQGIGSGAGLGRERGNHGIK